MSAEERDYYDFAAQISDWVWEKFDIDLDEYCICDLASMLEGADIL